MKAFALCALLCACTGAPALLDAPVDAGAVDAFACPDGAVCATQPDGGCDPQAWQTSCGTGLVCSSDGTCGKACGDGNTVCDPAPANLCAMSPSGNLDCDPPCTAAGQVVYRGTSSCFPRGLLVDSANGKCFVPCWIDECSILGDNFCGPPIDVATAAGRKRVLDALKRMRRWH